MSRRSLASLHRILSASLALCMFAASVLSAAPAAFATASTTPASIPALSLAPVGGAATQTPAASAATSSTVVKEDLSRRDATSKHFLLSDGSYRAAIYSAPIHYKDSTGKWSEIDRTVTDNGVDSYTNTRAAVKTTFQSGVTSDGSVEMASDSWSLDIAAPGMADALKAPAKDTMTYFGVGDATSYEYKVLGDGLKETIVLYSPSAPATVSVNVTLKGAQIKQGFDGIWRFCKPGTDTVLGAITEFSVFDSSKDASGNPAVCQGAEMQVEPTTTGATITYTVPQTWLKDPARVFPVRIDPTYGANGSDSFAWAGGTGTSYNYLSYLRCGYYYYNSSSKGYARPYMIFDASSLASKFIRSASLYTWVDDANSGYVQLWRMNHSGVNTTWNSQPGVTDGVCLGAQIPNAAGAWNWDVRSTVQAWAGSGDVGALANAGFRLNVEEDKTFLWRFGSVRSANAWERPALYADYADPAVTSVAGTGGNVIADGAHEVTATVHVSSSVASDVRQVRMVGDIDKYLANGNNSAYLRGHIYWTLTNPGVGSNIRNLGVGKGWMVSELGTTGYNSQLIDVALDRCDAVPTSDGYDITYVFRPKSTFGDLQTNSLAYQVGLGVTGGAQEWGSTWKTVGPTFNVVPAAPNVETVTSTPAGLAWWIQADLDGDGISDARNDAAMQGRGTVALSWPVNALATSGYKIMLSDGATYRQIAMLAAGSTSYTTAGKGLFPTDSVIASMTAPFAANPFVTTGLDLRDDPSGLYAKTTGARSTDISYHFKIVPFNSGGQPDISVCPTYTVGLPGRTVKVEADPRHTEYGLGDAASHSMNTLLDTGALNLDTTDLSIASWGPAAELSRHYDSTDTSGSVFAPGWRFSFEQSIAVTGSVATYRDASGDAHRFAVPGVTATGGNKYISGPNTIHVFSGSDSLAVNGTIPNASVLVVGGGGGGFANLSGGGGAGGVVTGTQNLTGNMSVTVGAGGAGNSFNGGNSVFGTLSATGGGRGASRDYVGYTAGTGGSGGGGAGAMASTAANRAGGAGTVGQGFAGGTGTADLGINSAGGGGGGAGAAGSGGASAVGGRGGNGIQSSITGTATYYGGGGGGSSYYTRGAGGLGGGGTGGTPGTPNTGGGGGEGSAGGSGIVVISYPTLTNAGTWQAPPGYHSTLATDFVPFEDPWYRLTDKGRTVTRFDGTGHIRSVTDRNGNTVNYTWSSGQVQIIAANGQSLVVGFDASGKIASATYTTADGVRSVTYAPGSSTASVTLFGGTSDQRTVQYDYASGRLATLSVPGFAPAGIAATWRFDYRGDNGDLTRVRFPGSDADPDRRTDIASAVPNALAATITRYGQIDGTQQPIAQTYTWSPRGTLASKTNPNAATEVWTYQYNVSADPTYECSPAGKSTSRTYTPDGHGNVATETDEDGHTTTYTYDAADRVLTTTDALGSVVSNTYDQVTGDLTYTTKSVAASYPSGKGVVPTATAETSMSYNASGTPTMERKLISGDATSGVWATTTYDGFAPNGQATIVTNPQVAISADTTVDLTATKAYDQFGSLLWEKDAAGIYKSRDSVYSASGRLLASSDAAGAITHRRYDMLGSEIETSRTAGSDVAGWVTRTYDPQGRLINERAWADTAGTLPASDATHIYDSAGREVSVSDSVKGSTVTRYDASDNVIKQWAPGAATTDPNAATRHEYDVVGHEKAVYDPGATTAKTSTTYYPSGKVLRVTSADGSYKQYDYDAAGNAVAVYTPGASGSTVATATYEYDLGGRCARSKSADGAWSYAYYDLLDRQVYSTVPTSTTSGGSIAPSGWEPTPPPPPPPGYKNATKVHNSLGWVLDESDTEGMHIVRAYDVAGRLTNETSADKLTATTYDAFGRLDTVANPDGMTTKTGYDAFGRAVSELQKTAAGETLKDTRSTLDVAGRVLVSDDQFRHITRTNSYSSTTATPTATTAGYGTISAANSFTADGRESTNAISTIDGTATINLVRTITARDSGGRSTAWGWTLPSGGGATGGRSFDEAGHLRTLWGPGFASGDTLIVAYDPATGRRATEHVPLMLGGTRDAAFGYTDAGRLASVTYNGGTPTTYGFDAGGNITSVSSGMTTTTLTYVSGSSRLSSVQSGADLPATFGWDALHGWRTSRTDSAGTATFVYDNSGRLTSIGGPGAAAASFTYDARGQRMTSSVTSSDGATGTITTNIAYTYEGLNLLSLAATRSVGTTYSISYALDGAGSPYAGVYRASETTHPLLFGITTADHSDVVALTDGRGTAFASYTYDAWGNPTSHQTTGTADASGTLMVSAQLAADVATRQVLRYASYCWDASSGLYYCSARYYDPSTMQFITKDSAKADGEESAYQYCGGDPVGNTDPGGLAWYRTTISRYVTTGWMDWKTLFGGFSYIYRGNTVWAAFMDCIQRRSFEYLWGWGELRTYRVAGRNYKSLSLSRYKWVRDHWENREGWGFFFVKNGAIHRAKWSSVTPWVRGYGND